MERDNVGTGAAPVATGTNSPDLEVKDAQLIFGAVWRELEGLFGRSTMRFPRELILLGGAPGAGKGTNSDFIRKVRSIDAPPIVISQLLDTPEALAIKARGAMVGDREVVGILFRKLLDRLRRLPVASDIVRQASQDLVRPAGRTLPDCKFEYSKFRDNEGPPKHAMLVGCEQTALC